MIERLKTIAAWIIAATFLTACIGVFFYKAVDLAGRITLEGALAALGICVIIAALVAALVWAINRITLR